MAMIVGGVIGHCEEEGCDKDASTQIRGKNYCYECGKNHIHEAVEDGLAQARRRHER